MRQDPPRELPLPHSPARAPRRRPRWIVPLLAGTLLLAVLACTAFYWWQHDRWNRFATVSEGVLYRSGRLAPDVLATAVARYGLRTVVDLTPATGGSARLHEEERKVPATAGGRYVEMPIRGRDTPTPEQAPKAPAA